MNYATFSDGRLYAGFGRTDISPVHPTPLGGWNGQTRASRTSC